MRLLLDECLPRRLKRELTGHEVLSVEDSGFKGLKNGELLRVASEEFDVLITVDRKLPRKHKIANFDIAIIVLVALSNRHDDLSPLMPRVIDSLRSIRPGEVVEISSND